MIRGFGNPPISAFLISDGGVGEDLKTGYALSGYQETLLLQLCKKAGLKYQNFYKTTLIKEELPVKPIGLPSEVYLAQNKDKVDEYGNILINEINDLSPNLLIPLGELSFNYLTSLSGIRKFRGSILAPSGLFEIKQPHTKVLPILGPYPYLYNEFRQRFITGIDFTKIPKYLNDRPIPDDYYKIWVAKSAAALRNFLERSYKDDGILVFDIETFKGIPTCISFCFDGFESVCIPFLDQSIDLDNRTLMFQLVARILKSKIRKVNQNIKFDWKILERWGFEITNVVGDTMLAASCLYCEFPKNLGFLTSIYTDLPYFKDEGKQFDPSKFKRDQFYLYNAKDSLATHQIYTRQMPELVEQDVNYVYQSLIKLMPIYKQMENRGIRVDESKRDQLLGKYQSLYDIECMKLSKLAELNYINPLSPTQMRNLIYTELGYSPVRGIKKTKGGDPSTDEDSLMMLRINGESKRSPNFGPLILDSAIACRKIHKVIEILELRLYPDKRFRCEFNLAGTETGRTSAGGTIDELFYLDTTGKNPKVETEELGHSLQTIGKHGFQLDGETYGQDIRSMYIPTNGYNFVEVDLSGAEARVDAVLSGIYDLSYFEKPGIHKLTGSWCFDCAPEEIKKNQLVPFGNLFIDRYHVAKQVRHAGERNIQAAGLVTKLLWGFTVSQGDQLLKKFHKFQPEIRAVFHKEVIKKIDHEHCLIAPNGRRRDFFDRPNQASVYNEGISVLPQAIVSDQTKFEGILKTALECPWAFPITEAHDGSLWEVPIGRELEFYEIYKRNIETPIDFRKCSLSRDYELIIPCEGSFGPNWYDMEDIK